MRSFKLAGGLLLLLVLWTGFAQGAESVRLAGPEAQPRQPQADVADDGTIYVAYGSGNSIYVCRSTDSGSSYSDPAKVGEVKNLMLGRRRGPRIAAGGSTVVVTAIGREGNLLAWRSAEGGRRWHGPATVNDQPSSAREGLHDLAAGPDGELYCVWLDLRNNREMELWGARSDDGGRTWSPNVPIYRSPDGHICECCHPNVAFDREGGVYVMWRNWLNGARDMYLAVSRDGGRTFGPAEKLGRGTWNLDHCPMDGGHLVVLAPGKVATVWRRDKRVFRTAPGLRSEQHLGPGEQPWAAATDGGAYFVWISRRPGDLWLLSPSDAHPTKLAAHAADPVVAAPPSGAGPVVVVWESGEGKQIEIRAAVVSE